MKAKNSTVRTLGTGKVHALPHHDSILFDCLRRLSCRIRLRVRVRVSVSNSSSFSRV